MKRCLVHTFLLAAGLLLQSGVGSRSHAAAGDVDLSFDPGSGVDGTVHVVVTQPDGKLILGGRFRTVKGFMRHGIARLNADGGGDDSFDPGTGAYDVRSVALQPDGKVLIGGGFVKVDGIDQRGVARLNPDGSLDTGFKPGPVSGSVNAIAAMPDGRVFIGGTFTKVNGIGRGGIALLDAHGNLDTSFDPGPFNYALNAIVALADGRVLVAGIAPPLWRLNADGSRDTAFDPDWRNMGEGFSMAVQPDGKVLIGNAPAFAGISNGILRLNTDGTRDGSFQPATGLQSYVGSVAVQPDGKLLIAGYFATGGGSDRKGIARLNSDGSLDGSFEGSVQSIYPHEPTTLAVQTDGKVIIGGGFRTVNGSVRRRLARLNSNGSLDGSFDPGSGMVDSVASMARQPDGQLLVGGRSIDRLNPDGSRDDSFDGEFTPPDSSGKSLAGVALQTDGRIFLAARYDGIIRLNSNGSRDTSLPPLQVDIFGQSALINAIAVQPDGKTFIAGNFGSINGSPRHSLALVNPNGSVDEGFFRADDFWEGETFAAMVIQRDGKSVVGGIYLDESSQTLRGDVRRFQSNGEEDLTFFRFIGGTAVLSLALQTDGKLLVGGRDGDSGLVRRLNPDGSVDGGFHSLVGPNGPVRAIALQPDGRILIGGDFTSFGESDCRRIARLNGDGNLDTTFNAGTGADGSVSSILVLPDGPIIIGGEFLTVDNRLRPYVARLHGTPLPVLTINQSGALAVLSWPSGTGNYQLQQSEDLQLPGSWVPVTGTPLIIDGQFTVRVPMATPRGYFRLHSSP